jgi:hypothetical protein
MIDALLESLIRVWTLFQEKTVYFFPRLLAALVVIVIGWLLALIARAVLLRFLKLVQIDVRCERSGFALLLRKADIPWPPSEAFGKVAFWGILLSTAIFSLSALEMAILDQMVSAFFLYLPNLAVAALILAMGFMIGNFLSRATLLAAINQELPSAHFIAETVRILLGLLAITMAMEQLGIARSTVTSAFAIAFGGITLGLALAFGLGGRELAKGILERRFGKRERERRDPMAHL